jgi:hypothetical protein
MVESHPSSQSASNQKTWREIRQEVQEYLQDAGPMCLQDIWRLCQLVPRMQMRVLRYALHSIEHQISALERPELGSSLLGLLLDSARIIQLQSLRLQAELLKGMLALGNQSLQTLKRAEPCRASSAEAQPETTSLEETVGQETTP